MYWIKEDISIPDSVNEIGVGVFEGCEQLKEIHTPAGSYAEQYANDHGIPVEKIEE